MHVIYVSYTTINPVPVFYARYLWVIHHQKPCTCLLCTLSRCQTPKETFTSLLHTLYRVIYNQKPCDSLLRTSYIGVIYYQKPCTSLLCTLSWCHTPPETLNQSFLHVILVSYTNRYLEPVFNTH